MLLSRLLGGSALLALAAGAASAQVTIVNNNRSDVQNNGPDNRAFVEQATQDSDRNTALTVFNGAGNRAFVNQVGFDNATTARHQGDRNTSNLRQLGFGNSATLTQVGSENGSSIDQYVDPRIGRFGPRTVSVEQYGSRNSSTVTQALWDNVAQVRQGTSTDAPLQANGAVSTIVQSSAGNSASVTMLGGTADAVNRSHVEQTRIDPVLTRNVATVNMSGGFNASFLYQTGVGNTASHSIAGEQNTAIGKSWGDGSSSVIEQNGYRTFATLSQYAGNRNSSRIEQKDLEGASQGGDRQVYVLQGGSDNSSTVQQRDTQNTVVVNQAGDGTVSNVNQSGNANVARVSLWHGSVSAPNKSAVTQQVFGFNRDTRLLADVTIRGSGNESSVAQEGQRHVASVDMAGGGAGNDEAGRRRGNSVTVAQSHALLYNSPAPPVGEAGHVARVQVGVLAGGGVGTGTSIDQRGRHVSNGNDASVRQEGQYDKVSITQDTRFAQVDGGAVANVSARGLRNRVSLTQYGREFAMVTQGLGQDSSFNAVQYDSAGSRFPEAFYTNGRGNNSITASQYGDRNQVSVGQEGTDNNAIVWQKVGSSDNSIEINQGLLSRSPIEGNPCFPRCQLTSNSSAAVTQGGRFNQATSIQYAAGRVSIQQNGVGTAELPNTARAVQFNTVGEANILQMEGVGPSQIGDPASGLVNDVGYFAGGARASEARIRQTGLAISASIEQRGRGQYAFIDQSGANTASIIQDVNATNATAIITQSGSGNVYNVVQDRPGQYINVSQTGTNNSVTNVVSRP